jgi:hypothetical protein
MIRPISIPPPVPDAPVFDPAGRANAQRHHLPVARRPHLALIDLSSVPCDLARGDWDLLFRSVMNRLSRIAAEPSVEPGVPLLPDAARRLRSDVRECVSALGQLHAWQRNTAASTAELEQAHRDLRWSLAWPRVAPSTSPDAVVPS